MNSASASTTPKNDPHTGSRLSPLDVAICSFLALPLLFFCAWFKPPVAVGLTLLAAFAFCQALAGVDWRRAELSRSLVVVIGVVAIVATALGGIGHFFYANQDWVTRDAVLHDLSETAWPPRYMGDPDSVVILRAPVAYYLPAAALGSLFGPVFADKALYAWTVIGFGLFLCGTTSLFAVPRQRWICLLVMIGFGGLDLVGYLVNNYALPAPGEHIERWASLAQYSSNSTLLFWVPNHALAGWLGIVLVLRLWRTPLLGRITPLLAATIPLWSPLSAIGLVPFFLAGIVWRRDVRSLFAIRSGLPFWGLAFVVSRYLTMDTHAIPSSWAFHESADMWDFVERYAVFCMLEFGLLALVLFRMKRVDLRLGIALVVLCMLPLYKFGAGNDLVMRASIPSLAVLALAAVRPLADTRRTGWHYALMVILGVGALGAAQEPERALLKPRWALKGQTLGEISNPNEVDYTDMLPPNYAANLNQPGLAALLRQPSMVRASRGRVPRTP